jgi:Fic family protein
MDDRSHFERLSRTIEGEADRARALGHSAGAQNVRAALLFEEIHASVRLAGASLTALELRALLERGRALGEHRFADYLLAVDYAAAARYVAAQEPVTLRKPRPYLRLEEIVELHLRATRGAVDAQSGTWRTTRLPASAGGVVAPPPWKIPAEMRAFTDRIATGPAVGTSPGLWVATALERFTRLQPFGSANGRVARLIANLLLRRLDLPPLVAPRRSATYTDALELAQAGDPWRLALLIAKSVADGLARLLETSDDTLRPLAELAPPHELAALYKAAQRGRLRTLRRGAHLSTTRAWLNTYALSRSAAGRRTADST